MQVKQGDTYTVLKTYGDCAEGKTQYLITSAGWKTTFTFYKVK